MCWRRTLEVLRRYLKCRINNGKNRAGFYFCCRKGDNLENAASKEKFDGIAYHEVLTSPNLNWLCQGCGISNCENVPVCRQPDQVPKGDSFTARTSRSSNVLSGNDIKKKCEIYLQQNEKVSERPHK
jgi:hypothetical protein